MLPTIKLHTGQPTISPDPERLEATCDLTALPQAVHFVGRGKEISTALEKLLAPAARGFVLLHGREVSARRPWPTSLRSVSAGPTRIVSWPTLSRPLPRSIKAISW